ncbi:MAG: hypothetical protein J5613_03065 [Alphaproteobacteria bacterium]|nr:hypothetical protein [Alphaproteobacteria bacterium]
MKNEEVLQSIETTYDVIFGQRFILRPRYFTEIKPIKLLGDAKILRAQYQSQRRRTGQNR